MSDKFDLRMTEWREQIDGCLHKIIELSTYPADFKEILEYALFPGGKRLRPILFLEWHSLYAPPDDSALHFACGLELMHTYSLIHDDMPCMDNDDFRRGKPSVHKMYGECKALLAGDALVDLAYIVMIDACSGLKANMPFIFGTLRGDAGLVHGQYLDLYGKIDSLEALINVYSKKTAALIDATCTIGYLFAQDTSLLAGGAADTGAPENDLGPNAYLIGGAMKFGSAFGIAFQLYDDLSEYIAGESADGSSVLDFLNLEDAKLLLNNYLNEAVAALDSGYPGDTSFLRELVEKFIIV